MSHIGIMADKLAAGITASSDSITLITPGAQWAARELRALAKQFEDMDDHACEVLTAVEYALRVEGAPIQVLMWRDDDTSHLWAVIRDILRAALCRDAVADLLAPLQRKVAEGT